VGVGAADTPESQILTNSASRIARTGNANEWLDSWIIAQSKTVKQLCLVAHDPLAPPVDLDAEIFDSPGHRDTRGGESYPVLPKKVLVPGAVQAISNQMLGDQYVLFVIEDEWPLGNDARPLDSLAYSVRHVIVPIVESESYGIISGFKPALVLRRTLPQFTLINAARRTTRGGAAGAAATSAPQLRIQRDLDRAQRTRHRAACLRLVRQFEKLRFIHARHIAAQR